MKVIAFVLACIIAPQALAQQPVTTKAPTQPGKGQWVLRTLVEHHDFKPSDSDSREGSHTHLTTHLSTGLEGNLSLMIRLTEIWDKLGSNDASGFGDMAASLQWRFLQNDTGPVDTTRAAVFLGLQLPTGDDGFTRGEVSPYLGVSYLSIAGRHGLTHSLMFHATEGSEDDPVMPGESEDNMVMFDSTYLYRLSPATWGKDLVSAWYTGCELNGAWESDGDLQLMASPFLLYEAPAWAAEFSIGFPFYQDVSGRPECDRVIKAGLRFLF